MLRNLFFFGVFIDYTVLRSTGERSVASIFSEPKSNTVVFSTVIAIFEIINILGLMDNAVIALNNYDLFPEIPIIESKEKLILLPSSMAMRD